MKIVFTFTFNTRILHDTYFLVYSKETGEIGPVSYLEECPRDGILECVASFSELDDLDEVTHVFTMDMEWGDPKKGAIYDNLKEYSPAYGKYSVFVHPIIRLYEMKDGELKYMAEHHVIEDWHVIWDNEYGGQHLHGIWNLEFVIVYT